jgi:hypothetical protein
MPNKIFLKKPKLFLIFLRISDVFFKKRSVFACSQAVSASKHMRLFCFLVFRKIKLCGKDCA